MSKIVIGSEAWYRDPVLSKRSITPPRRFERAGVTERVPLTEAPRVISDRVCDRIASLEAIEFSLSSGLNSVGITKAEELISQLKTEKDRIALSDGVIHSKYTPAVAAYEAYLPTVTPTRPLHSIESYILADGMPPVLHFTINTEAITVAEGAGTVIGVAMDYLIAVAAAPVAVAPGTATSVRSGVSGGSGGGAPKATKLLHPLELEVFKSATDKLLEAGGPRAVVIDIFDKEDAGAIKLDETRHPKKHAVVLCKQLDTRGNVQIFVIDPSNSDFSRHLDHPVLKAFVSAGRGWVDIIADTRRTKIYSVPEGGPSAAPAAAGAVISRTGPEPVQFRDCVDIAVKIANGLNAMTEFPRIDITSVYGLPIIQAISNLDAQNKDLLETHFRLPLRLRQTSDVTVVDRIYKLEHRLQEQRDLAKAANKQSIIDKSKLDQRSLLEGSVHMNASQLICALEKLIGTVSKELVGAIACLGVTT